MAVQAGADPASAVLASPPLPAAVRVVRPGVLGMWIFLVSESFAFGGLFVGYGVLRVGVPLWRPAGEPVQPWTHGACVAALLVLAGLGSAVLEDALAHGILSRGWAAWGGTLAAVAGSLAVQGWSWSRLWPALRPGPSAAASAYYVLTAFHALHVVGALAALLAVTPRAGVAATGRVEVVGIYVRFLVLTQLLLFACLYVVGR